MPEEVEFSTADTISEGLMAFQGVDGVAAAWALKVWS